jgi:hypothetical protein
LAGALLGSFAGLLEAIGFALDGEDLGVVDQAIDQRDDAGGVWKDLAQFGERPVGGDERAVVLVTTADELVGQVRGEGAFSQDGPSYFDHCAYMATENNPQQAHPGIVVIDVSDPRNPQASAYLADTPAGLNPHENNKVNEERGLLGLAQSNGPNFAVYDLNADCAHPRLASSITVPNSSRLQL